MSIAYSGCVSVALGIQHAMFLRHIVTCALPGCTVSSRALSHRHDIRTNMERKACVLIMLQLLPGTFLILRRNERGVIKKCIGLYVKYPLFLSDFNET